MVLISFVCHQKVCNFAKLRGCGLKIEPATPIPSLKLKWMWQAQFLSYTLVTLQNYVFFKDVEIMLVPFFGFSTGFRLRKNSLQSAVHIFSSPCIVITIEIIG